MFYGFLTVLIVYTFIYNTFESEAIATNVTLVTLLAMLFRKKILRFFDKKPQIRKERKPKLASSGNYNNDRQLSKNELEKGATYHLQYIDGSDKFTERDIIFKSMSGPKQAQLIKAQCLLREDTREFYVHRIVSLVNKETGEVII